MRPSRISSLARRHPCRCILEQRSRAPRGEARMRFLRVLSILAFSSVLLAGARPRAAEKPDQEALKAAKALCAILTKDSLKQDLR